jgi:NAD(P)-dependent dehydrogenase (short-subunit alcohol dehydrogenase family)
LRLHRVDVTDAPSVAKLAAELEGIPIDLVVNVAGVDGGSRNSLPQLGEQLSLEELARTYDVNALGPLRISLATLPNLRRGAGKKLVHITSGLGSIGDNTSGGYYGYRMAKVALNMMSRSLAVDLREDGIISFVINPGWVATAMGGPSAPTSVDVSVRGMLDAIDGATMRDSGEFLHWKGGRYPW